MASAALVTYNSKLNKEKCETALGIGLLPITKKDKFDKDNQDIVDEAIALFRI